MTVIAFSRKSDALFLDLDGTMIDIAPRPDAVDAPTGLISTLQALHQQLGGALAVVSGRSIDAIDAVLRPLRLPASGVHGAEVRFAGHGPIERHSLPPVPDAVRWLLAPLSALPGVIIEDKSVAIAIHFRQAPAAAERVREVVTTAVGSLGHGRLATVPGKCVLEIKPAGFSKGTAIATFMARPPWRGRRPVFVGDDVTDEAAFAEVSRRGGLGLAVGEDRPGAVARFATASEVRDWLAGLLRQECTT